MKIVISIQSDANSAVSFEIERTKTLTASTQGMALSESKQVLTQIQRIIVQSQIIEYSSGARTCPECGTQRRIKDYRTVNFKSLFGTVPVKLPRLFGCCCEHANPGARILKIDGLKNWVAPELEYIQSHLASTVSYARASQFLSLLLPADKGSSVSTVRRRTLAVGERLEDELRHSANTEINHSANRSDTKSPFVMGLDSGYIRDCQPGTERSFEVVVGRILSDPAVSRSVGFVRTVENNKEVRHRLKNRVNQVGQNCDRATVMTDGDAGLRSLQLAVLPKATHILDWFHLTRHLTIINRVIEGEEAIDNIPSHLHKPLHKALRSLKWRLWHGQFRQAIIQLRKMLFTLKLTTVSRRRVAKRLRRLCNKLWKYLHNNADSLPNYAKRYHAGNRIATSFVESAVNQLIDKRMSKTQQMRWSQAGAHALLQVRAELVDGRLESNFARWYPGFNCVSGSSFHHNCPQI